MKFQLTMVAIVATVALATTTFAQEHRIKMSSGTLAFEEVGSVKLEGYDGNEVVITSSGDLKSIQRAKGLKLLNALGLDDNTGIGLSVENAADNTVKIYELSKNRSIDYSVKVPTGVKVRYTHSSPHGDDFYAKNVSSELEVKTLHSDVKLDDIKGPLTVSTVHGDLDLAFSSIDPKTPSSIVSIHGDINMSIPAAAKLTLSLKSDHGDIYTDLDIKVEKKGGLESLRSKQIDGTLNGGGTTMTVSTGHSDIFLRKK